MYGADDEGVIVIIDGASSFGADDLIDDIGAQTDDERDDEDADEDDVEEDGDE